MQVNELLEVFRPVVPGSLVATDFDGTLAPIVPDPADSRVVSGGLSALVGLAELGAQIAVITGRDARTVVELGGFAVVPRLRVCGVYGAEQWHDGHVEAPPVPAVIERLRAELPAAIDGGDPALWIEDKQLSLVVHARRAADPAAALATVAGAVAALGTGLGLEVHPGSGVLELRLPGYDKGAALDALAADRAGVLFLGDDLGDLPAFERVRALRARGAVAYGVGVCSSGVAEVEAAADVVVPDPPAVARLLADLLG